MKRVLVFVGSCALASLVFLGDSACSGGFPTNPSGQLLEVTITDGPTSKPASRLPLSFTTPDSYTVKVTALTADGAIDTSFNGYVRLSSQPGSVQAVSRAEHRTAGTYSSQNGASRTAFR